MKRLIKLFAEFWLVARVYWSNYRNTNNLVKCPVEQDLDLSTVSKLAKYINKAYSKFTYTYDGPDELFDSMRFPAQCYYEQFVKGSLRDDCDGFHSALYHVMSQTSLLELGLKPYLLSITDRYGRGAHCFFIARNIDGKIFIQDYRQSTWFDTADQ